MINAIDIFFMFIPLIIIFFGVWLLFDFDEKLDTYLEYRKAKRYYKKLFKHDDKLIKIINYKVNNNRCLLCSRLLRNNKGVLLSYYKEFIVRDNYIQICEKCLENGNEVLK